MILISIVRILLFPLSVLYGIIVAIRNFLFDVKVVKSTSFDVPVICVGNLSVGGTGKTPQIEYLIRLLQDNFNVAVLSRGYKRKSKGFVLADTNTTVADLGDEPYQYFKKFKKINVAVHGNRVEGVQNILSKNNNTEVVLLDDAYQHRKIKPGYQILLTSYHNLYYHDFMMPTGNLRELWWGKKRANIIIVTKCPENLSETEQHKVVKKIKPKQSQTVLFSKIKYASIVKGTKEFDVQHLTKEKIIVVTGIANPKPLTDYLTELGVEFEHMRYADHHNFSVNEIKDIHEKSINHKILTTEKDYVRLQEEVTNLYYLPIETAFLNKKQVFDSLVLKYINS